MKHKINWKGILIAIILIAACIGVFIFLGILYWNSLSDLGKLITSLIFLIFVLATIKRFFREIDRFISRLIK